MYLRTILLALTLMLSGCDPAELLADPRVAQREADAKAVGGACRFGLRSIEDCYSLNPKASKAAVFVGWKDMDQYMRDNKVEGVEAKIVQTPPVPKTEVIEEAAEEAPKGKGKAKAKGGH
jgi:hypothetical protein